MGYLAFRLTQTNIMSTAVATYSDKLNKYLHQKGVIGDTFKALEDNTGVQRLYIGYGVIFPVWCMAPLESNGSKIIYTNVILPLFRKHHGTIDSAISKAGDKAGDLFDKAMEKAKDYAAEQQLNKND